MKKNQTHPAAATSKNMLAQGLMDLLHQKSFQDITITELCASSQIARRTFYRNFDVIEDVISYYVSEVMHEFLLDMNARQNESKQEITAAYFTFWNRYKDMLVILTQNNLIHILFTDYIKSLFMLPSLLGEPKTETISPSAFNCRISYVGGGLWSVLTYWVVHGCEETPEEISFMLSGM